MIFIALEIAAKSDGWITLQCAQLRSGYSLDRLLEESGLEHFGWESGNLYLATNAS
jgi:hypothetical protein